MTGSPLSSRGKSLCGRFPGTPVLLVLLAALLAAAGCDGGKAQQAYDDALAKHRDQRLERLRSDTGWLTIAGLFWLKPGRNTYGTAANNAVVLPEGTAPARAGTFVLKNGGVTVRAEAGSGLALEGVEVTEHRLATDADGSPDRLTQDRLTLWVIRRGDRFGVRLRDPQSELRKNFAWLDFYPPNLEYRVAATFERYPKPQRVPMDNEAGTVDTVIVPGEVSFTLNGTDCVLLPVVDEPDDPSFFFVFSDGTSGKETYGGGRFLNAELEAGNRVTLDFNRAYNPPCAFNPYTTCPLPLAKNRLPVEVLAGEKDYVAVKH